MTHQARIKFLRLKAAKRSAAGREGLKKAKLNRELNLTFDESIADKFPDEHLRLKAKILSRLPEDNPQREKFADATARHIMGDPSAKVEQHMGVNYHRIHQIMGMVFPDRDEMLETLETTLVSNALIANAVFMSKAHELNPRDAALATGIFTQRAIEMKRDREGKDVAPIDFRLVVSLESTLSKIHELKQAKVIELEDKKDESTNH